MRNANDKTTNFRVPEPQPNKDSTVLLDFGAAGISQYARRVRVYQACIPGDKSSALTREQKKRAKAVQKFVFSCKFVFTEADRKRDILLLDKEQNDMIYSKHRNILICYTILFLR